MFRFTAYNKTTMDIRRTKPEKTGIRAPLGELELSVMRHVWACGEAGCLAQEVLKSLEAERPLALTTILTTLDRLHDKGILVREKEGKAYRYRPAVSEDALQERIVAGVLGDLLAQFPKAVAAYFAEPDTSSAGNPAKEKERLDALAERIAGIRARSAGGDDGTL
ncbi:MAG: BlaI/MecI/CopY family transcriptional regulator [Akkermansiaceae bacterium]|nr:BlaI/MecI/CopY family transcriptional regulator [Armatimonadota bacterium]